MLNKKEFLQLLEQEVEDFIQTQAEKVVKFEDDPMAYILQKYPSLQGTLEDLMTSSFEDYITGIYVMAPKPTTFKVLLHNGQQFYLIYARDSYIAKIAGKKYYLLNLGEEEYAIKAIAELLTMGKPPGSQGPDAEEENTTNAGEEASAEEVPAEGGDEGGEEELAETKEKDPIVKAKTPTLKFKILKESVEKKKSPLKFRIVKEANEEGYRSLTFQELRKRGGPRLKRVFDKIEAGTPFKDQDGGDVTLKFAKDEYGPLFQEKDDSGIKQIGGTSVNNFPFFVDTTGKEYRFNDLLKTPEFGGKGKGSGTVVEDENLFILKEKLQKLIKSEGGTIKVKIDGQKEKEIAGAETQFGTPKSDFNLLDKDGKPVIFISHKKSGGKGPSARDFIRWSGYTMYKDHPEVAEFNDALRKWVKENDADGLPNTTRFVHKIQDTELIKKLMYGPEFGGPNSAENVNIIIQGEVEFEEIGDDTYYLTGEHILIPPQLPEGDYTPYLTAAYRGDRKMFGIKNNEAIATTKPIAFSASNVYELQNGEFVKVK
jgi:hypothetical protein